MLIFLSYTLKSVFKPSTLAPHFLSLVRKVTPQPSGESSLRVSFDSLQAAT